ncbi:MarR family winged helix-turn-helix transcriptional regulator [Pleomorphomonas sp. JP5]|uniref:MarR family winged helix-turn-helix transcriptional regulator n=1 Tax=Pleomorphomonas sp. JP5 TaxID=2942998 RepID=UPI0020435D56|nr:MarR family transcriptional regulator [Pleomorphomonas sp. JP5]MCM5557740.1 MarR family transcriptional regulator [Pleomorphomonas sp. JP5]
MDGVDKIIAQWNRERPDLDVEPMALIGRLGRLRELLSRRQEEVFARFGLNSSGFDVLATLRRSGPPHSLSPGELMEQMMISSGTMTNRIDQLAKAGLVERRQNPDDRRGMIVSLTDKGFALIDEAVTAHVENQHRLVSTLSEPERAMLDTLLKSYLGRLQRSSDQPD